MGSANHNLEIMSQICFQILHLLLFFDISNCRKEPIKQTKTFTKNGDLVNIQLTTTADSCYQYTWVGVEEFGMSGNGSFPSCSDLEDGLATQYGREVPCYSPLVWTENDQYSANRPDPKDIVAACETQGCSPFCARGSGKCIKYTIYDRNDESTVSWESSFCGQGTMDEESVERNRCFTERGVMGTNHRVCFCD